MDSACPPTEFGIDFRGKQMGIAAGDVDIEVFMRGKTIENTDEFLEILNLVKQETIRLIVLDSVFDIS